MVSIKGLRWGDDVTPSLPELERFKVGMGSAADDELLAAATVAKSARQMLAVGDLVKVIDGDLKNLMGKVHSVSVDGNMVTILPKHEKLKEPLSFQAELLVKWFKMGDHIKIVGGTRHVGETGMVVKVGPHPHPQPHPHPHPHPHQAHARIARRRAHRQVGTLLCPG